MGIEEVVERTDEPRTRSSLRADLKALGLDGGEVILVHSSLSSLGWVCGGAVAVVQALLDALGPGGTLVVPTHTTDNSDPAQWSRPPVPERWWPAIRTEVPAYDPAVTPSRQMGAIAEAVRTWPGARRSANPNTSFAVVGPAGETVTAGHEIDSRLGEASPLGRLYDLDAVVLLVGVGYDRNTSFHLAEYRIERPKLTPMSAAVLDDGERRWHTGDDVDHDGDDFVALGQAFEEASEVILGRVGNARCRRFRVRAAVDFAVTWMEAHR